MYTNELKHFCLQPGRRPYVDYACSASSSNRQDLDIRVKPNSWVISPLEHISVILIGLQTRSTEADNNQESSTSPPPERAQNGHRKLG